ncbi:Peptidase, M23/M37 family [hydrothermal vent metagenome]|uniref:Peptidase, M23/M37 family n=1 Tax=hydrothermal vent metagenome TaxID=652676 RepID=A0A3B0Z5S1_9ZZZZ
MRYQSSSLHDYRSGWGNTSPYKSRGSGLRWALLGIFSGLALGLFLLTSFDANALKNKELSLSTPKPAATFVAQPEVSRPAKTLIQLPEEPQHLPSQEAVIEVPGTWHTLTIKQGDSLARIFKQQGIPPRQLHDILAAGGVAKKLTRIYPGQMLRMRTTAEDGLLELLYEIDALNQVHISRTETGYEPQLQVRIPDKQTTHAAARIDNSLFLAAQNAKLPETITMELAGIFGWDIDFALDIRKGDQFAVIYEELFLDGERIGTGNILAAEFTNQDKLYRAVRYTDLKGRTDYYTPDGRSMRKTFLRTPVAFSRISSRFSTGRKHPVLNRIRAHKGVDYAASRGTPIKATGTGKIVLRGRKGGYGKTVVIQHGSRYSTLYAHMNSYARGLRTGSRVQQGQIIGYVGSTGLATGPHLHYEFRLNGVHRNPLTVKLPDAAPLPKRYREDFKLATENLIAQLELAKAQTIALQDN